MSHPTLPAFDGPEDGNGLRDGDSVRDAQGNPIAIQPLLDSHRINSSHPPTSPGAPEATELQGGANADYVLPSRKIGIVDSAVFCYSEARQSTQIALKRTFRSACGGA